MMKEGAATVNDVGDISFPLVLISLEQRLAKTADYLAGIIPIQQKRTDAVFPHGTDAVTEHQPSGIGLDRGTTISDLDQLPRKHGFDQHLVLIPEMDVLGKHEVDVLVVLAGEHGVESIDFPGKERHALVLGGGAVQGDESEVQEVKSL